MNDPFYGDPYTLTDEEIEDLNNIFKSSKSSTDPVYNSGKNYNTMYDGSDWSYEHGYTKRKHEWIATTLIISKVYTCKHCNAKQEKTTRQYCGEDEF